MGFVFRILVYLEVRNSREYEDIRYSYLRLKYGIVISDCFLFVILKCFLER